MMKRSLLLGATAALACVQAPGLAGAPAPAAPAAAAGKAQLGSFGFDAAGMDRSVAPGDDFNGYASGTWLKTAAIPADKSSYGAFTALADLSDQRSRGILEEAAKAPGSRIGDLYASFMDEAGVENRGYDPLKPDLARVKAIASRADLARVMGADLRQGVSVPIRGGVGLDAKDPDRPTVEFRQGGLGLPDRDYYLKDAAALVKNREAYRDYAAQLLSLVGEPDAAARAAAVLAFETQLAQVQWTRVESRDATRTYNPWTRAQFDAQAPGLDWGAFFQASGLGRDTRFIVGQPSAITATAKLLAATPLPVLKDYLLVRTIDDAAPYLSKRFVDANFAFHGTTLGGVPELRARWKRGVSLVDGAIGEDLGQVYVQHYFPPETKAVADQLVKNIIAAMDRRLQNLAWMAPETRARARAKLASFRPKIGYPDKWRDYSDLEIKRDDLFGNVQRANEFEWQYELNKLGKPADRGEWGMTPMTINAYANPVWNEIVFPAAILQPPFFDPHADAAVNYGGIGAVIGHEMSHHFDDQGRKFDEHGRLVDWWTPQDVTRFTALTDRLVKQYDAYEPLPGFHVQGALTLGENMADLAGLTTAHDAYEISLGGKPAPVLDGFTGEQRFYLGWAQVWRQNMREAAMRQRLLTDPHAPNQYRADIVRNLQPWYDAFKPAAGTKLYLQPADRVLVW